MILRLRTLARGDTSKSLIFWILWVLLLLTIPMTSSPWVARFIKSSNVSPLAGFPLVFLLLFWFVPQLLRKASLPTNSIPLLLFIVAALFSSAIAPFYQLYPIMGQTVIPRILRGIATLAAGVGFYFIAYFFSRNETAMRSSLLWLYVGGVILLSWASIQAYLVAQPDDIPEKIQGIHRLFSIRDIPENRVTGFAYEPSWLGDLLVILYLPLWLASVVRRYSIFSEKPRRISIELGLLIWGAIVLFFSHSRIGLLSAMVSLGLFGLILAWQHIGRLVDFLRKRWIGSSGRNTAFGMFVLRLAFLLLLILIFVGAGLGIVWLSSQSDWRLARVFRLDYLEILKGPASSFYGLAENLAYAERVMWWVMGLRVFSMYPIFGVGLGATGFLFRETIPAHAYHLPEMVIAFRGQFYFPNPTNLWIRLLGDTGIVGFIVFLSWLLFLGYCAIKLCQNKLGWRSMMGLAGLLALFAQIFEGFSLGTFALPQLWIMLGFLTAAISPQADDKKLDEKKV